jgi:hypothetical protein
MFPFLCSGGSSGNAKFRSVSTPSRTSNLESGITANAPAGVVVGDLLLATISMDASPDTLVVTWSGWTELDRQNITGPDGQLYRLYGRIATGSESYAIQSTQSTVQSTIVIAAFYDTDGNLPTNIIKSISTASNTTPITQTITGITATAGSLLAEWGTIDQTTAADTWSHSTISGFTKQVDDAGGDWNTSSLQTLEGWAGGDTGNLSCTVTRATGSGNGGWAVFLVEVKGGAGG